MPYSIVRPRATLTLGARGMKRTEPKVSSSRPSRQAPSGPIQVRTRGDSAIHMVERVSAAGAHQDKRVDTSEKINAARWSE
jgi:hypothetical protein